MDKYLYKPKRYEKSADARKPVDDGEDSVDLSADGKQSVFVDIALGAQKHRITLYPDSDPHRVAEEFAM